MGATRDCKHGQLARSCEICGLEADLESQAEYVKELQARLAWLQKTLTGRQRRHYASALRQLRNFRDGLRGFCHQADGSSNLSGLPDFSA